MLTEFLLRRFAPDYQKPMTPNTRTKIGTLGTVTGVVVNLLLSASKFAVGMMTGAVAITADAANNLSDCAGSLMALLSVRLAQKPVDREHPFGHGRLEYLGALGVGVLILLMALELVRTAVGAIASPVMPEYSMVAAAVLLGSIACKAWLYFYYHKLAKMIDSLALKAAANDALSDVLATSVVLLSMLIARFSSVVLDGWMGLAVALLVFRAGFGVCRDTIDSLMGGKPDQELGRQIIDLLMGYDGILGTHDLIMHDYGPGRCVASVHAEVDAAQSIVEAHEVIDQAEREISQKLNIPICIHMDPIMTGDEETERIREKLSEFLAGMDGGLRMHDLRRVPGEDQINLIFDVVVPAGYSNVTGLKEALHRAAKQLDERYCCVIHIDYDYYRQ